VKHQKSRRKKGAHLRTHVRVPTARLHVRKGDVVRVIAGNDKGKTGEVKEAYPREGRVLVAGINLRWRHRKATRESQGGKGERVQAESPIHASNVKLETAGAGAKKSKKKAASKAKAKPAKGAEGGKKTARTE
jgi:large subunit ribosomal protein L24